MGKKIDIRNIIYNDLWDVKYIEKKNNDFGLYLYLSLEIKSFLTKFLSINGLTLHSYKINIQESELKIFLSYLKSPKLLVLLNNLLQLYKVQIVKKIKNKDRKKQNYFNKVLKFFLKNYFNKVFKKNFKVTKKSQLKIFEIYYMKVLFKKFKLTKKIVSWYNKYIQNKQLFKINIFKVLKYFMKNKKINNKDNFFLYFKPDIKYFYQNYLFKKLFKYYYKNRKILLKIKTCLNYKICYQQKPTFYNNNGYKKFKIFERYKLYYQLKLNKLLKTMKINNFVEKIIESLNIFLQNKFSIKIYFYQLNRDIYHLLSFHQLQIIKKITVQLRRFQTSKFFLEGLNLLFFAILKKDSSQLIADFVASYLKSKKNHNIFFRFLNQVFLLLLTNQISKIKSVKILIKGRFNKASRSKKK